jgi:hypothetical protein
MQPAPKLYSLLDGSTAMMYVSSTKHLPPDMYKSHSSHRKLLSRLRRGVKAQ